MGRAFSCGRIGEIVRLKSLTYGGGMGASAGYLRDMNTLFDAGTAGGLTDRQLLERFAGGRNPSAETAFEALVHRHGPMVMRVCHSTLGDQADAHDAFQATFLVLVRKSNSIRRLDSVGSWLFGVASRVARRARVEAARRRCAEREGGLRIAATADHGSDGSDRIDLGELLQAEVERLPDHLRAVVVLCYWEGLTHEQAAARLGCPLGTVRSRVARARKLLHRRLTRRGLEPVAGLMAAAFDSPALLKASAVEIPATLVNSTVQVAKLVAAGGSLAQLTSPFIAFLVPNVIRSMFMTKLRTIVVCVLLLSAGAYGLSLAAPQADGNRRGGRDSTRRATVTKSKAQPAVKPMGQYVVEPPDVLTVEVLDALPGRPISGERPVRPDGTISLGFYGDLYVSGLTLSEIKTMVIRHLQTYIKDEELGLIKYGPENDQPLVDRATGKVIMKDPKDSDKVSVAISKSDSKHYYVQGAVAIPGRCTITGLETVLDAIHVAGGLAPDADHNQVYLYRNDQGGGPVQPLKIDVDQILMGDDLSTNYQLMPGDRLVARRRAGNPFQADGPEPEASEAIAPERPTARRNSGRQKLAVDPLPQETAESLTETVQRIDKRLGEVERKLDVILQVIQSPRP